MKTLIIIPALMFKYRFSAPLAWLFSKYVNHVRGMYSFELNKRIVKEYDSFIVELNWYIELFEFQLIVKYIGKYNKDAQILFGDQYSQLRYKEISDRYEVDYFTKGDDELPVQMYLDRKDVHTIPNMVGRDFENSITYVFTEKDYDNIEFNLDWFPDYSKYTYAKPSEEPCRRYKLPLSPYGKYHIPSIIASRGACASAHKGCKNCFAYQKEIMNKIFNRGSLVISNETLIKILKKLDDKFDHAALFINSKVDYDFSGHYFNLDCTIEVDSMNSLTSIKKILPAFKKTIWHLSIYEEGLLVGNIRKVNPYIREKALEL